MPCISTCHSITSILPQHQIRGALTSTRQRCMARLSITTASSTFPTTSNLQPALWMISDAAVAKQLRLRTSGRELRGRTCPGSC